MNCHSLEDAIVDVGRGRDVGPGTAAAVDSHVEHCAVCAARLERQRELTAALRELAAATGGDMPSRALERRLLAAFEAGRPAASRIAIRSRAIAAAAAALTAIAGFAWWQTSQHTTSSGLGPASAFVPAATRSHVESAATGSSPASVKPDILTVAPTVRRRTKGGATQAEGFVMLPAAVGLPDFESGEIVRMELPLASLPAYGLEIVPDAAPAPVQADLLIGQDGQARAIRLVTQVRTRSGAEQ
jgi:hypothetical protein